MQPIAWWVLQAASMGALLACAALSFASSGRVGRHTPYGSLLFVMALGFWSLLTGLAFYLTTIAAAAWDGPPGWGDVFTLAGWALLTLAFVLLLARFPPADDRRFRLRLALPGLVGLLCGGLAFVWADRHPDVNDLEAVLKASYILLDSVFVVVLVMSIGLLMRLRRASLGRLYLMLGLALAIKTTGDILFLVWPRESPLGLVTTATYPLAGVIATLALALHHRAVRPMAARRVLADPSLTEEQLILRDVARRLRGLAGDLGGRLVLSAGATALGDHGFTSRVQDGVLVATAPRSAWAAALAAARARTAMVLGAPANEAFDQVLAAYGRTEAPA